MEKKKGNTNVKTTMDFFKQKRAKANNKKLFSHIEINSNNDKANSSISDFNSTMQGVYKTDIFQIDSLLNKTKQILMYFSEARENLLLQSSDWPFLITTWQAKDYATDRFNEHVERFGFIADMIESGHIDDAKLKEIEAIDNCFPVIDYRVYQSIEEGVIPQQEKKLAP